MAPIDGEVEKYNIQNKIAERGNGINDEQPGSVLKIGIPDNTCIALEYEKQYTVYR